MLKNTKTRVLIVTDFDRDQATGRLSKLGKIQLTEMVCQKRRLELRSRFNPVKVVTFNFEYAHEVLGELAPNLPIYINSTLDCRSEDEKGFGWAKDAGQSEKEKLSDFLRDKNLKTEFERLEASILQMFAPDPITQEEHGDFIIFTRCPEAAAILYFLSDEDNYNILVKDTYGTQFKYVRGYFVTFYDTMAYRYEKEFFDED